MPVPVGRAPRRSTELRALRRPRGGLSPIAMTIGTSLFLITVGVILMAVGIFGLLLEPFLYVRYQDPARRPV